jgi:hypothetical protein
MKTIRKELHSNHANSTQVPGVTLVFRVFLIERCATKSHQLDSLPTPLPHWICLESVFQNTSTSLPEDCPRLFGDPGAHLQQSRGIWLPLLKLCMILFWSWLWSLNRNLVELSLCNQSQTAIPIYQMTVSSLPECNCAYFLDMISKFGRKRNSYQNCKPLYYIFIKVSNLDAEVNLFIHTPTFSFNEVKLILKGGLLTQFTS